MENTILNNSIEVEDRDHYLDFDMFDYIYSLVCTIDDYSNVINPIGKPLKKFDNYELNSQVFTDGKSNIIIETTVPEDFNNLLEVCNLYKFSYDGPIQKTDINRGNIYYRVVIHVPMAAKEYPMMLEDYFTDLGVPLDKVMPAKWLMHYRNKLSKIKKEQDSMLNDSAVESIYQKYVTEAWRRGDIEIAEHYQHMVDELRESGLEFKKNLLRKRFFNEFEDDEYDEEEASCYPVEIELF